ncbi:C40 family peptidase [Globicatella sanguinis]|uniref:C40 family peptidase n=1 Tax=Globicatella sanguinis TaxID=13076 RepID=UPI000C795F79|nr:NlpC/P60 family protein [Globicatella sanguinis]MDK7631080.1 NlpC/P60 family protein [Globicatella sanguinis]WIK65622.1 NlpC/P60 family protein [Globicatella sanguinis]WKT55027.1 NlpC/P60 family protein [Globicatella sanguinis]
MKLSFTKKAFKTLFTSTIILGSVASPIATFAQDYDTLINDTQAAIDNLSAQQATLYSELALGYEALTALKEEAETLLAEIAKDDEAIKELNGQIEELEELIAKREELLDNQARAVQANGGSTNYLSLIASSESISEFVGRLDVVRKMVSSNKDLLATQKEDKEQVVKKQDEVKAAKEEKINKQIELEGLKASLEEQQNANEEVYNALTGDITLAAGHRDALVAEKAAFEEQQAIAIAQAEAAARMAAEEAAAQEAALVAAAAQVEETTVANEVELPEVAAPVIEETVAEVTEAPVVEETVAEVTEAPVVEETVAEVTEAPVVEETVAEVTEAPVVEETVAEVTEAPAVEETVTEAPVVDDFGNEDNYEAEEAARIAAEEEAARIAAEEEAARIAAEEEAARIAAEEEAAASAPAATGNVSALLSNASQYLGTPYVWGGKSPSGFDCSGFVQYVFMQTYGIDVGGYTGAQEYAGTQISVAEAQPGDLYFWGSPGGTYHVAIATGGGGYIHASQPGTPLEYNSVSSYFMPSFAVRVNVQ